MRAREHRWLRPGSCTAHSCQASARCVAPTPQRAADPLEQLQMQIQAMQQCSAVA